MSTRLESRTMLNTWTPDGSDRFDPYFTAPFTLTDGTTHTVRRTLNDIMEFDHVVYVGADGTVSDTNVYAPESVYMDSDDDGQVIGSDPLEWQGWKLLAGYTGAQVRDRSKATVLHASESIGCGLARDILATPGYYVALSVETLDDDETPVGWAVAYRENVR